MPTGETQVARIEYFRGLADDERCARRGPDGVQFRSLLEDELARVPIAGPVRINAAPP
jgi:hypothetical protein